LLVEAPFNLFRRLELTGEAVEEDADDDEEDKADEVVRAEARSSPKPTLNAAADVLPYVGS